MTTALLVIDYTNDFVADDGKLTCGEPGQRIEQRIMELIKQFHDTRTSIVFAVDVHAENDPYHPETKLFPAHNIAGTNGREQFNSIQHFLDGFKEKLPEHIRMMDKTRYSAFAGTDLAIRLRERNISTVHLTGVCTDICILHTAVDAFNLGFSIIVHADAVQSFNQQGHHFALQHFKNCLGAEVVESSNVHKIGQQ
ncbi:cysteine hydrolase family protein [Geomicrobium sp. JSM 1781026]|uniref:cysteine hydrolase family protein n=1 Tax=Geomicrobium sp. JSM 1781026 TaxID=3344580 RepID=UPI0035C1035D